MPHLEDTLEEAEANDCAADCAGAHRAADLRGALSLATLRKEGLISFLRHCEGMRQPEPDLSAESTPTGGWCQMKQANI